MLERRVLDKQDHNYAFFYSWAMQLWYLHSLSNELATEILNFEVFFFLLVLDISKAEFLFQFNVIKELIYQYVFGTQDHN